MRNRNFMHKQSGSALVVGMILLLATTFVAISTMGTSALDLIMAGNEQYQNRAFQAAEAGVERAWVTAAAYNTTTDYPSGGAFTTATTVSTGLTYKYKVSRPDNGVIIAAPSGSSANKLGIVRFAITSVGNAERGANTEITQELYQEALKDNDYKPLQGPSGGPACGSAANSLDSTTSDC